MIDTAALRELALGAKKAQEMPDPHDIQRRNYLFAVNGFRDAASPDVVLALLDERDGLVEAAKAYRDAQDTLDNREYAGINGESYGTLMRCRNVARDDLDAALASTGAAHG